MLFEKIQLESDEQVLKTIRKHWFIITVELLSIAIMLLLPLFVLLVVALFPQLLQSVEISLSDYSALIFYCISGWSLLSLMAGFMIWTHYHLDLWIITDRRIISIDQIQFFNRNVHIFRLERLQDIEFSINGIIPTFLNFGTLRAQTASSFEKSFIANGLPDPRGLQGIIQNAVDKRLNKTTQNATSDNL